VTFTVTPAAGANVSNVRVDFGDGSSQNLGAISAAQTVPHAYSASGTYTATATASDASGDAGALTTTVIVGSLPVTLTGPATTTVNTPVTFTVGGTAGTQVDHYEWTLSDGTAPFPTTAPQMTHTFTTRGAKIVRVDVIGVGGGLLGTATTGTSVN
jgi:PKD repeat protein